MTPETAAYNRRTASNVIRSRLGLLEIAPSDWTYNQRVTYNKALAEYIADNPQAFTDAEVQTAKDIEQRVYSPLDDTSLAASVGLFGDAFLVEAEKVIDTGGKTLRTAIYIAAAVAVAIYVLPYAVRAWQKTAPKE